MPGNSEFDVFVSYCHEDRGWAHAFAQHLKDSGLSVFIDQDRLEFGRPVPDQVLAAITAATNVAVVCTPASKLSDWVQHERAYAIALRKRCFLIELKKTDFSRSPEQSLYRADLTNAHTREHIYHRLLEQLGCREPSKAPLSPYPSTSFELVKGGRALAIGAHWDDILLGCFGTLLKLKYCYRYEVVLAVLCTNYHGCYYGRLQPNFESRIQSLYGAIQSDCDFELYLARAQLGHPPEELPDRAFSQNSAKLNLEIRQLADRYKDCNLVFAPPIDDRHEDHALTGKAVFSHFRESHQSVLEYEIKPHVERGFIPNVFVGLADPVPLSRDGETFAQKKVNLLNRLIIDSTDTKVGGADLHFDRETLISRLRINAQDHGGDREVRYGEVFRGQVRL
jgi:LmbE family N-acetylglucosaminyl deacetylase